MMIKGRHDLALHGVIDDAAVACPRGMILHEWEVAMIVASSDRGSWEIRSKLHLSVYILSPVLSVDKRRSSFFRYQWLTHRTQQTPIAVSGLLLETEGISNAFAVRQRPSSLFQ